MEQLLGTITQALDGSNPERQRAANAWLVANLQQLPFEALLPVAFEMPQQQQAAFFAQNMLLAKVAAQWPDIPTALQEQYLLRMPLLAAAQLAPFMQRNATAVISSATVLTGTVHVGVGHLLRTLAGFGSFNALLLLCAGIFAAMHEPSR
jgi:hypothetical protein